METMSSKASACRAAALYTGFLVLVATAAVLCLPTTLCADEPNGVHWPGFRGHRASGIAEGFATPTTWNAETGLNIAWKRRIPGLGHSSPAIWGDRIFVTTAISGKSDPELKVGLYGDVRPVDDDTVHRWLLFCLNKNTGKVLWERTVCEGVPKVRRHPKATHANCTPATDGEYVVAFFGSEGLYCYDIDGNLKWNKDFGLLDSGYFAMPDAQWEFGSSPVIHAKTIFVQCDVQKGSFVAAYNLQNGSEVWRTPRDDVPTWSTPTIHHEGKQTQVVCNGYKHAGGYDASTGKELWRLSGGGDIPVPTPVAGLGLIFLASAHGPAAPLTAIRPTASGDISLQPNEESNEHVAWVDRRCGVYMQTPLVYGDYLYACKNNGILACYSPKTGQRVYRKRLGSGRGGFTASAVGADGKVYFTGEEGKIYVVKAGPEFAILAENVMDEVCMATPAISEGVLFIRAQDHLYAISAPGGD
ncbi:MAG: PQQ-binding-like beta-propeller repeat protein [Planctomycetota bacterium]